MGVILSDMGTPSFVWLFESFRVQYSVDCSGNKDNTQSNKKQKARSEEKHSRKVTCIQQNMKMFFSSFMKYFVCLTGFFRKFSERFSEHEISAFNKNGVRVANSERARRRSC